MRKGFSTDLARSAGLAEDRFPENHEEADIAEAVLTRELEKLSLDEHERVLFDVHGIAQAPEEEGSFVQSKLAELEQEIDTIPTKLAYERAIYLNRDYVENRAFRLMFLRSEMFDAKHAAKLIVRHFEMKAKMFGNGDILARDIRSTDLTPSAIATLESGECQVIDARDASGRPVICVNTELNGTKKGQYFDNVYQSWWYFSMILLRDEETQRNGHVLVIYVDSQYGEDHAFMRRLQAMDSCIPHRTAGHHICYNDASLRPYVAGVQLFLDEYERFRVRVHFGEPKEVNFGLQTFGIPTNKSPMRPDGNWSVTNHLEWLQSQRVLEEREQGTQANVAVIPRRFDVLFGKNKQAKQHTGYLRLVHLCTMHWVEYEAANKFQKTEISDRLASIIRQSNGRFLKWNDEEGWQEVDEATARAKISHFFRHIRSKRPVGTSNNTETAPTVGPSFTGERRKRPVQRDPPPSSTMRPDLG